ncbi:hypothetical protein ACFCYN_06070 [Gottfriedia sp. NPDC056225]|uniref:hypothetical protein n=1 Tax=Gottfriedia sp. NPDC056225 TaxID=3345751 RepID=UPI0035E09E67
MELTNAQLSAIEYITNYSRNFKSDAKATIKHILQMLNVSSNLYENAVEKLKAHAKVALHFHIAFEDDSGETYFFIFHEESNEDYLIHKDKLLSITNN